MGAKSPSQKRNAVYEALIFLGISISFAGAVTHTVQFGDSLGFTYFPSSFSAIVGDTVTWTGDFSMHPLSSTIIPSRATSWHNSSGTAPFSYAIKVAGTYSYQRDVHFSMGMAGSFVASEGGVIGSSRLTTITKSLMLQAFSISNTLFLKIQSSRLEIVSVKLFSILGNAIDSIPHLYSGLGTHPIMFSKMSKGLCILKVLSREETLTRIILIED